LEIFQQIRYNRLSRSLTTPRLPNRVAKPAEGFMEENHSVAIVGDNPEALLLSVLYAEAGISNYLVGPFGDDGRTHPNRPGVEEALWLLGIFKQSGKIRITPDDHRQTISQVRSLSLN